MSKPGAPFPVTLAAALLVVSACQPGLLATETEGDASTTAADAAVPTALDTGAPVTHDSGASSSGSGSGSGSSGGGSGSGSSSGSVVDSGSGSGSSSGATVDSGASDASSSDSSGDGGDAGSIDAYCASGNQGECIGCCQAQYYVGLHSYIGMIQSCICGDAGPCGAVCAKDYCVSGTIANYYCGTCLTDALNGPCGATVTSECAADAQCTDYLVCSNGCH